ncbi:flagellar assembly protein A [Salinispira pacifica]|uniref:Flagellar Assembly Protein A N-terminal region domain-containing protein n=1 Tax=Salinispira pacifica TaxID=1307761 RepID=V5WD65_9SPIO|nr:flagellar assembly protein A [Salinispira pacifica]AHC13499.1 hypothetical protein L21SP2_0053 [Salinispira pacifica]
MAKKERRIQGSPQLIIDDNKLQARIQFTKSSEGADWNGEKIVALLKEEGIRYGFKEDDISEQIKIAGEKSDKEVSFIAVKGDPATDMRAEEPEYASLEIPEELAGPISEKLQLSSSPDIQKKNVNKVKKQKTVQKKSPIPFMPAKEEVVSYTEEEVSFEKVYVDPTVESYSYVIGGQLIAQVHPVTPGVPGKDIFGDIIQPKSLPDPYFYNGENTTRTGSDIRADLSGIVRQGTNWTDVIPFSNHEWEIRLSEDKATCLLDFSPGDKLIPLPAYDEIRNRIEQLEYPMDTIMPEGEIANLLEHALEHQTPIKDKAISDSQDAHFEIMVSDDGLRAELQVRKGRGDGRPLVLKELGKAINASGVSIADRAQLKQDILDYYNSPELELHNYLLAEGKPPKEGAEQPVDWSARFLDEKEYLDLKKEIEENREALQTDEDGSSFPLDAIDALAYVENEQRIVTMGQAQKGEPGMDVYGKPIEGLPGKSVDFVLHDSVDRKDNIIITLRSGLLERAIVENVYHLRVRPRRDSRISIEANDSAMEAFISIDPGEGSGAVLTEQMIRDSIEAYGVVKGIDEKLLEDLIARSLQGEKIQDQVFARGLPPREGDSETVNFLISLADNEKVTIREDGSADFKTRNTMTRVSRDQAVARITPPKTEAVPGWDVYGRTLDADDGSGSTLEISDKFRREDQEDGTVILYATVDGELLNEKGKLDLLEVHTVQGNVGMETGNIKFPGTVQVAGNVESGFYVMSNDDIKIMGAVDRALLSAGGDILIQGGIKGGGKSLLRSKQNILAAFVEQATILSVKDMKIQKSVFRSNVKCNGKLMMGDKSSIIGGVVKVKEGLDVHNLGSERGIQTRIHFGQDYLVEDQIHVQEKEIKKIQIQIAEADATMKRLAKERNQQKLKEVFNKKTKLLKMMEKRNLHLFNLKERFEQHFESRLIVRGSLHNGVVLESHGREMEIIEEKKNVIIQFDTGLGRINIEENSSE